MRRRVPLLLPAVLLACAPGPGTLPAGSTCARNVQVDGDAAAQRALASATAGTCVVLASGTYRQPLSVPAGVTVVSADGAAVRVSAGSVTVPAVTLGAGALLADLEVRAAPGVGVAGVGGGAKLYRVNVAGAAKAGVVFWCEDDCRTADPVEIIDTQLTGCAVGLFARGARVRVTGGAVSDSTTTDLTSGYGIVAAAGAMLEVDGTSVERNQELGVLIDGAGDTDASLARVSVRDNLGRGVWAQGLTGSIASPRLRLTDAAIERNRLVGVGLRSSSGLSVTGGRIASTIAGPAAGPTPGVFVMVGDGLGLFERTGAVQVAQATLEANARSQALIDTAAPGVTLAASVVVTPGSAQGVVVQRTPVPVTAPMVTSPPAGQELPVSAPALGLPAR